MHDWPWHEALCLLLSLCLPIQPAIGACFHQTSCGGCISEVFAGGECVWYTRPGLEQYGTCLASFLTTSAADAPTLGLSSAPGDFVPIPNARWEEEFQGETTYFSVPFVDEVSLGSCFELPCQQFGTCGAGYYAIRDEPCYSGEEFIEFRSLTCCRLQVNWDGFLLGFEERAHELQGSLQHGACCASCSNGEYLSGCTAFFAGACLDCPSGRYNNQNVPGPSRTSCEACQPCPPGQYRLNCARANPGRCVACESGTVKLAGLEGSWDDACEACPTCPRGAERVECTATSVGHCQRCGNGLFNAGYCRACDACTEGARTGCGASSLGVCALCTPGVNYRVPADNRCYQCPSCPSSNSSNMVRIGCGHESPGECLSLDAAVTEEGQSCETAHGSLSAQCPGSTFTMQWTLHSASAASLVHGSGDCTATGTCAVGLWHLVLYHRSLQNPDGEEVSELLEWYPEETNFQSVDGSGDTIHVMDLDLSLPAGLEDDAGYFFRVFFEEFGGDSSFDLTAHTQDFAVVGNFGVAQAELSVADEAFLQDQRSTTLTLLSSLCNGGDAALVVIQIACQRQRAILLGLAHRSHPTSTISLPSSTQAPTPRAEAAAAQVTQAEAILRVWDNYTAVYTQEFPRNASAWQAAVEATKSAHAGDSSARDQVAYLALLAQDLGLAQHLQADDWHDEITHLGEAVRSTLDDLKTIDTMLTRAAEVANFDIVAMAQGLVQHLWDSLQSEPRNQWDRLPWISHSLDLIGAATVVLIGSWQASWNHPIGWDLQAELGDIDTWLSEAVTSDVLFGNVAPASTAPALVTTRARAWSEFRGVAELWLQRWQDELDFIGNLFADEQIVEDKSKVVEQMLDFAEDLTEEVLEPLTRAGSSLLRGGLPEVHGCESATDGRCLRRALQEFPETSTAAVIWHGLDVRSWVTATENADHRARVASELAGLARNRAELLDKLLLQMLDLRDLWAEPNLSQLHAAAADEASSLLQAAGARAVSSTDTAGDGVSSDAEWRWQQILRRVQPGVADGPRSARLLAYRRLQRFEQLTTQVVGSDSYRVAWAMEDGSAAVYAEAVDAGVQALRVGIFLHMNSDVDTAQVLFEADDTTMPLLFECLQADNAALLRLHTAEGADHVRIHSEVRAFLVPPTAAANPFAINEDVSTTVAPPSSVAVFGEFIEVGLERLPGETMTLSGEASFVTRQRRTECETLTSIGDENAMWTHADGTWRLTVRDGRTHRPVHIDEGSRLMLFFTAEVPSGQPPFPLLLEQADTLYRLPFQGDCENVVTAYGPAPTARTSSSEASQQTGSASTASSASSSGATSSIGVTTRPQTMPPTVTEEDEDGSSNQANANDEDGSGLPVTIIAIAAGMLALFCLFLCGFYGWRYVQLRQLKRIAAMEDDQDYEANAAATAAAPLGYETYYGQQYYQQYQHQLAQQSQEQYEQYRLQYEEYQRQLLQQQGYLQPQPQQPPVPPTAAPRLSETLSPPSPQRGTQRPAGPRLPVAQPAQKPPILHLAPAKASQACVQVPSFDASSDSGKSSTSGSITSEGSRRFEDGATPQAGSPRSSRSSQSLVDVSPGKPSPEAQSQAAPPAPRAAAAAAPLDSHTWGGGSEEVEDSGSPDPPATPPLLRETTPGFGEVARAAIGIQGGAPQPEKAMIRANSPAFGEGSMSSSMSPTNKSDRLRSLAAQSDAGDASISGSATLQATASPAAASAPHDHSLQEAGVAASQPAASGAAAP